MPDTLSDKLRDFEDDLKHRNNLVITLLTIAALISPVFTATAFNPLLGIDGATWKAIYIVATVTAGLWWLYNLGKYIFRLLQKRVLTRERILSELLDNSRRTV